MKARNTWDQKQNFFPKPNIEVRFHTTADGKYKYFHELNRNKLRALQRFITLYQQNSKLKVFKTPSFPLRIVCR